MTIAPDLAELASDDHDLDSPPVHPPGHQLAPGYLVIEHVRRGEDLDCYEAWSVQRYCRCFVKTLRPDAATDVSAHRHLAREARLLLSLTHPHLVRAYEYVIPVDGQPPMLVLENLTGATLSYILNSGPQGPGCRRPAKLSAADLGHLGQHLCSALRYLHSRDHLHLDVKPSNIIASDGVARLIDLSLARRPGRCLAGVGTPGYMSPEQVCGGHLGPPADVWGVGLVLYEAATGCRPFDDDRAGSSSPSSYLQLTRSAPPIRTLRRLPATLATALDACLADLPAARPTLAELDGCLAAITGRPHPPSHAR